MNSKKDLVPTLVLCGGLLLAVCSIFCFFGSALTETLTEGNDSITFTIGSIFVFMFGGGATIKAGAITYKTHVETAPLLTVVFVLAIIALILAIVIVVGLFTKKIQSKQIMILTCVISTVMLVAAIMALASKNSIIRARNLDPSEIPEYAKFYLGGGIIAYAVLNFVGIVANAISIVLNKKAA